MRGLGVARQGLARAIQRIGNGLSRNKASSLAVTKDVVGYRGGVDTARFTESKLTCKTQGQGTPTEKVGK